MVHTGVLPQTVGITVLIPRHFVLYPVNPNLGGTRTVARDGGRCRKKKQLWFLRTRLMVFEIWVLFPLECWLWSRHDTRHSSKQPVGPSIHSARPVRQHRGNSRASSKWLLNMRRSSTDAAANHQHLSIWQFSVVCRIIYSRLTSNHSKSCYQNSTRYCMHIRLKSCASACNKKFKLFCPRSE